MALDVNSGLTKGICIVLIFSLHPRGWSLAHILIPRLLPSPWNSPAAPMAALRRLTTKTAAGVAEAAATSLRRFTLRQFISAMTSAAAAQPQFDYDHYCINYRAEHESRLSRLDAAHVEDSEGAVRTRELQLVFLGSPRSKKHVYAEKLSKILSIPHISMASLVRQELSPRSSLYRQIANAVNCGTIVPEDILIGLLSKRLKDGYDKGESGFILEGIPRSLYQANIVDQLALIDLVVNFRCFNFCTVNNGIDSEGAWKKKLQDYAEQTKPLEDYYRKQNKLINIEVGSAPEETWRELLVALHLQHMIAAPTSEKIT